MAFQALGNGFPTKKDSQAKYIKQVIQKFADGIPKSIWNVRVEILTSLAHVLRRVDPSLLDSSLVSEILPSVFESLLDPKYSVVRTNALEVVSALIDTTEGTSLLEPNLQEISKQLSAASALDPSLYDKVEKIKDQLVDHPSKKRKS